MLTLPMMRTARLGSLPISLRHFLLPPPPHRSFHATSTRRNPVMKDLLRAASNEKELREAVEVVGDWMATGRSQQRWDTAPEMIDILLDKAPTLNATSFLLDIFSDLTTYNFPTVPPTRTQYRRLLRAVVHQPSTPPRNPPPAAPVPRSDLNYLRYLYPRLFEADPLRCLVLLEGYHALGAPEGSSWRFFHEKVVERSCSRWTMLDAFEPSTNSQRLQKKYVTSGMMAGRTSLDPEMEALMFNPEEAREVVRGLDALRGAYQGQETFLRMWERLDLRRAGVKFHRDRVYNLIHDHLASTATRTTPPKRIHLNTLTTTPPTPPPSPTRAHLKRTLPPLPLTQQSISDFLSVTHLYHAHDPLVLLFELHLRSLVSGGAEAGESVRALGRAERGTAEWEKRLLQVGGPGNGSGGSWIDREDRERMRQSLGLLKGVLGERRRFWDGLDPVWLREDGGGEETEVAI